MKFCNLGRKAAALVSTLALGACLSSCGSGTIGYLYVLGQLTSSGSFGQISGFKIDDRTGNLTNMVGSPYSSGGSNPANVVVFPGGRYVFVLNKGTLATAASGHCPAATSGGVISEFLVGGDGVLTFQQNYTSQGINPVWISADASGRYLYVLDQAATTPGPGNTTTCDLDSTSTAAGVAGNVPDGDITVFAVANDTGRLTLIQNQQFLDANHNPLNFFPVGPKPTMLRVVGGYVYTMDTADQSVYVYSASGSQLVATQTNTQPTNGINITSIGSTPGGNYIYITDAGLGGTNPNYIRIFTIGSNGALAPLTTGPQTNAALTSNPVWTLASANNRFLYVVNQGNNVSPNNIASSITAYTISSTGQLQQIPDSPYPAGSGPVCMVEDPTNQYVYVSNFNDSTVTGYIINANTGQLSSLSRTTVFPISGQASCLAVSGFTS
jgi:6-phosphogluconolactonase (cycloisomerase 2 family)